MYKEITKDILIELNNKGTSYLEIANMFNVEKTTIEQRFKKFGIKKIKASKHIYNKVVKKRKKRYDTICNFEI